MHKSKQQKYERLEFFFLRSKKRLDLAPSAVSVNFEKNQNATGKELSWQHWRIHMKWCWVRVAGDKLQTSLLLSCFQLRSCVCGQRFECVSALAYIWLAGNFTTTDRMLQHRAIAICHPQFHSYFDKMFEFVFEQFIFIIWATCFNALNVYNGL